MSLRNKLKIGLVWRGSSEILQQLSQIVFTIILARLLDKSDFGLVAMAMLINRFVTSCTNIGFGTAIIQSQTVTTGQISAIFYIQLVLNIILSIMVLAGSEIASIFFSEPELIPIVQALSLLIFLNTFKFPTILLRKKLDLKQLTLVEVISIIVSNLIAIYLAFSGFAVWALVWKLIIQNFISGLLSFYFSNWLPTQPTFSGIKPLFNFGFNMLGAQIVNFFSENMISLLTAKFMGKEILGSFHIAYNLAIIPASKIKSILTLVLTAGFSKIKDNEKKFRDNYILVLKYSSLLFIPFMFMVMAVSSNLIITLYGVKWASTGKLLMYLSLVGLFRGLVHILRSAIISKGHADKILISTFIQLLSSVPIMYILMPSYGIYGLIIGYLSGVICGWIYLSLEFNKILKVKNASLIAIKESFIIGICVCVPVFLVNFLTWKSHFNALVLQLSIGLTIFILIMYFYQNYIFMKFSSKLKLLFKT